MTKIKHDSDNSLLQQNKTIDTLKNTQGTYEEDAIRIQKELVHTKEKIIDESTIELLQDTANTHIAKIKEDAGRMVSVLVVSVVRGDDIV